MVEWSPLKAAEPLAPALEALPCWFSPVGWESPAAVVEDEESRCSDRFEAGGVRSISLGNVVHWLLEYEFKDLGGLHQLGVLDLEDDVGGILFVQVHGKAVTSPGLDQEL